MKFSAAILALAATALAAPQVGGPQGDGVGNSNGAATANGAGAGNGVGNQGNSQVRFGVPDNVTVKQASEKCGDGAQLSCCNKATYNGDSTSISEGPLADGLKGLLGGSGSGAEGLGLFQQCSKLPLNLNIIAIGINDIVNQKCKQNIACCQKSGSSADGDLIGLNLPCIALGSIL
ncbi:hypothetical protein FE257_004481 [Aspergillus nanangensis]|uniref:Hydrophobin n=1 Tax=Aspergillus nanangensis TaxID=2582783 RepID=A0AAD4CY37_ASPNN|nr:hypothetical protein FE257_004481 [Aspergillus nanangensis]